MPTYLQTDIVDDRIYFPSMTFTRIDVDAALYTRPWASIIMVENKLEWYRNEANNGDSQEGAFSKYIDDVENSSIISGTRHVFSMRLMEPLTGLIDIFCSRIYGDMQQSEIHDIKVYNGANLIAHIDMTTGTIIDQTGNGNNAILEGGTWIGDGPQGNTYTKTFSESVVLSETVRKRTTKRVNESIVMNDLIRKRKTAVIVDSISMIESEKERVNKRLSDSITIIDTVNTGSTNNITVNLFDSVAILDSIRKTLRKHTIDNITLSESEKETTNKRILETLSINDQISIFNGKRVLLTDSISITDNIKKRTIKSILDAVQPSDSINKRTAKNIKLYDVIITSEQISKHTESAPLIGIIHLKGQRELFVYAQGQRDLIIRLKGGLSMIKNQNFNMVAGDSKTIVIHMNEDLTGVTTKWGLRQKGDDTPLLIKPGRIVGQEIHVDLEPLDTIDLFKSYVHECEVTDQNGKISTVMTGTVNFYKNTL